jgi:hypothetical protein
MSSLDLSKNRLGGFYEYYRDDGSGYGSFTATPEGPKVIADAIRDMRALTSLDMSNSQLVGQKGTGAFETKRDYWGETQVEIMEPDISGVVTLANAIKDMRGISQFTFSGDGRGSTPVTMEISMTEADFSAKGLGISGAIMVVAFLPKCT